MSISRISILGLLITLFTISCKKPKSSVSEVLPVSPSELTVTLVSNTQATLNWIDKSTNEAGFKVERRTGNGTFGVIATTASDITTINDAGLTPNTTYTYRVYSFNNTGKSLSYTNEVTITTFTLPTVTTTAISDTTGISAVSGGNVTNDGGSPVTARGIVWGTNPAPTVALTTKTTDGSGAGQFNSKLNDLKINTIYYVRAYATSNVGTSYGNEIVFTTLKFVPLASVNICNQIWSIKNLDVVVYSNGDTIPQVTDPTQWAKLTTGAWCYYNNDPTLNSVYGKLYNWYAVNDPRGLAPTGWQIPNDSEWNKLIKCLDSNADTTCIDCDQKTNAGNLMKATGVAYWNSPNLGSTNSSGFTSLPGGVRYDNGSFQFIGYSANYWTSTSANISSAFFRNNVVGFPGVYRSSIDGRKANGMSVRCIRK